jgi:hypothetical protein
LKRTILASIELAILFLPVPVLISSQYTYRISPNLNPTLVTATGSFNPQTLETFQWQGVEWVIFYGGFSTEAANRVHSLNMKAMVYVTALKEPAGDYAYIDKRWAQYDGTKYIHPADMSIPEVWFSPYGPYVTEILLPRIRTVVQSDADGVFLDTLILYPNADKGQYAHDAWLQKYQYVFPFDSQAFRYQSLYDLLERVYNELKGVNPDAVLMVSNNNVFKPADREKFASSIDKWQNIADGFVLEYVGVDPDTYDPSAGTPEQVFNNLFLPERTTYGVTKPMWLLYYTNMDNRFQYFMGLSKEQNFGYWTYDQYLLNSNLIIYDDKPLHFSILGNSTISNVKFDRARRLINFSVSGADGTKGYTIAVIPIALLDGNPIVTLRDQKITPPQLSQNSTHYIIRIDYHHSTQQVTIGGANTIPEFSSSLFILTATALLTATLIIRRHTSRKTR